MSEEEARLAVVDALRRCADAYEAGRPLYPRGWDAWNGDWQRVGGWRVLVSVDVSSEDPDDD